MTSDKLLIIHHAPCFDGFTAAWLFGRHYRCKPSQYCGTAYNSEPPWDRITRDTHVVIVDFSYPLEVLTRIAEQSSCVVLLDHHKTSAEALQGFSAPNARVVFDMNYSGAGLAWDWLYPGLPRATLVNYVEDRDLWRHELPHSHAINAAIASYEMRTDVWSTLERTLDTEEGFNAALSQGEGILRRKALDVAAIIASGKRKMRIGGQLVRVCNAPVTLCSDVGHVLAEGEPFAAVYYDTPGGRKFSLRSASDGVDVSAIAARYGGGGHYHAAGFRVPLNWEGDQKEKTATV